MLGAPYARSDALHPAHRRVLEAAWRKGVQLEIVRFAQSTHTAEDAARALGAGIARIVKSLVFIAPRENARPVPYIALVSGADQVEIARLAAVVAEPTLRRATAREASELTGYAIGGIPPIGHAREIRVVMDPGLGRFPSVWAAAGTASSVFEVPPATLRDLAGATVAPIAAEKRHDAATSRDRRPADAGSPS